MITGGNAIDGNGCFYLPTILSNIKPGNPVFDEETFGPVAAVIRFKDDKEAIIAECINHFFMKLGVTTKKSAKSADLQTSFLLNPQKNTSTLFGGHIPHSQSATGITPDLYDIRFLKVDKNHQFARDVYHGFQIALAQKNYPPCKLSPLFWDKESPLDRALNIQMKQSEEKICAPK